MLYLTKFPVSEQRASLIDGNMENRPAVIALHLINIRLSCWPIDRLTDYHAIVARIAQIWSLLSFVVVCPVEQQNVRCGDFANLLMVVLWSTIFVRRSSRLLLQLLPDLSLPTSVCRRASIEPIGSTQRIHWRRISCNFSGWWPANSVTRCNQWQIVRLIGPQTIGWPVDSNHPIQQEQDSVDGSIRQWRRRRRTWKEKRYGKWLAFWCHIDRLRPIEKRTWLANE